MKYIKMFENLNELQVGDYVACEDTRDYSRNKYYGNEMGNILKKFIYNNVGEYFSIDKDVNYSNPYYILVKYDNVPKELKRYFKKNKTRYIQEYDIKFWSKNKEDVEAYIAEKKYNL